MSNIFSTQNIIDRIDETRYVVEDINKNKCKNKVLFIWSDSGLGKTSIVKKASLNDELSKPIIIVDTPPINKKNWLEMEILFLTFLRRLAIIFKMKRCH